MSMGMLDARKYKKFFAAEDEGEDEEGKWVTIRGRKILIKEGESVEEAFDRSTGGATDTGKTPADKGAKISLSNSS